jgi:FixJ family two-component response regulator
VGNVRLLILDDDPIIGRAIQDIAESVGAQARFLTETKPFFLAVDAWHPTHIAVDLVMPEMDGVEVLAKLAERKSEARVIITSGLGGRESFRQRAWAQHRWSSLEAVLAARAARFAD